MTSTEAIAADKEVKKMSVSYYTLLSSVQCVLLGLLQGKGQWPTRVFLISICDTNHWQGGWQTEQAEKDRGTKEGREEEGGEGNRREGEWE